MLTTNRADLDSKFRLWRQHGMTLPDTVRHTASQVRFEEHDELGYNYRMTDIQAAIGREQLKRLPGILDMRRTVAKRYHDLLRSVQGAILPEESMRVWRSIVGSIGRAKYLSRIVNGNRAAGVVPRERPEVGDDPVLPEKAVIVRIARYL